MSTSITRFEESKLKLSNGDNELMDFEEFKTINKKALKINTDK